MFNFAVVPTSELKILKHRGESAYPARLVFAKGGDDAGQALFPDKFA